MPPGTGVLPDLSDAVTISDACRPWMPLVPIDAAIGPMRCASGSQRLGNRRDFPIGAEAA